MRRANFPQEIVETLRVLAVRQRILGLWMRVQAAEMKLLRRGTELGNFVFYWGRGGSRRK
jgi:hypothetical protein